LKDHSTGTNNRDDNAEVAEGLGQGSAMHRFTFACLVLALMAQGAVAKGETTSSGIDCTEEADCLVTPEVVQNIEVFHLVVIGDSIAWGAGLNRDDKYSFLVAKWLAEQLGRPVNVKVLAHTGATLARPDDENEIDIYCDPDCSSNSPSIQEQIDVILFANDVDLVLMSGGINDVRVDNIINAGISDSEIVSRTKNIEAPLYNTIIQLLDKCKNAKIIVTGYYPIISDDSSESKLTYLDTWLHPIDHELFLPSIIKRNLVINS
jgi:hypothetical protein